MSNKDLSIFLQSKCPRHAGFIDKLKISYRPYVCPFSELLEYIPKNSSVFDIGCGSGMFLSLIANYRKPTSLGGVEISDKLINYTADILRNINQKIPLILQVFDGKTILDEISNFNYIFMIDVLHHIPKDNQISFLKMTYQKMSPGSKLILKDIDADSFILSRFNKIHDWILSRDVGHELRLKEVQKELKKMKFKILSVKKKRMFVYPHYTIICEK